jgi:GntR family histidine utilization transcriptional repressor
MSGEQAVVSENSNATAVRGRPFVPGQTGNPNGRPKKGNAIRDLLKSVPVSQKRELVKIAYQEALKGDVHWAEWIVKHSGESGSSDLRRVHGVGTFVADTPRHASLIELRNIADEIRERGMHHRADVLRLDATHCDAALAADLELAPDTRVYHVQLVHWQNDQPVQLEDRYVNPALAPDFLGVDFHLVTPTQYLIGLFRPDEMEHIVQAVMPDSKTCRWLAIPPEEPCLRLRRRTWKHRVVVTLATFLYPSSRYDLGARYATDAFRKGVEIRASDGN